MSDTGIQSFHSNLTKSGQYGIIIVTTDKVAQRKGKQMYIKHKKFESFDIEIKDITQRYL